MSYDPKRVHVDGRTVYELTDVTIRGQAEQANRWSMTVQSARQAHEADDATMERIAATVADLMKHHATRLAQLEAAIQEAKAARDTANRNGWRGLVNDWDLEIAGLTRAHAIMRDGA